MHGKWVKRAIMVHTERGVALHLLLGSEKVNGEVDELRVPLDQTLQALLLQKLKAILLRNGFTAS